jgi:His-Xaa-Ser repeat protein HxsA
LKTLPGNSSKFFDIVRQVQTALYAFGFYSGAIDGVVGPQTKTAISAMQAQYGLPITGTITPDVLDALNIEAK